MTLLRTVGATEGSCPWDPDRTCTIAPQDNEWRGKPFPEPFDHSRRSLTMNVRSSSLFLIVLAGCADVRNPPTLWLALDGAETQVTLIDHDPAPY
jgi:hypothetical protein